MSYTLNSFVNKNEADALKEMIFRRVRERAQAMSENVQDDVMDLARESFVSNDNPFSKIVAKAESKNPAPETMPQKEVQNNKEIGFPQRTLNQNAVEQGRVLSEQITASALNNTMNEAREGLSNKKSFMGALNFLNSQAAVSLMRTKTETFEVLA